ncbi:MAG TPA: putative zinc-binding metallopeptidase [Candidatus Margulisiibacteriota bacterium]|nr:putative zinc-binding metallopeptidase [Candidatus Margulisiibacteriota bacterium]
MVPPTPAAELTPEAERRQQPEWVDWPDERLLGVRLCDLDLHIEGTELEARIAELYGELEARHSRFRPFFWLSDEWFTPDGVPGVAVPFYLAHPRLARLEQNQMLEVEGGTPEWCLRILRHETGHAIDNAYNLRRRRRRQQLFGSSAQEYPEHYTPRPYSKSFVLHLEPWYGQSHPDEDFAETFAVWLNPTSLWRERYAGWPALKKLEYMDRLMAEIGAQEPLVTSHRRVDPLSRLRKTLRKHYEQKRQRYGVDYPNLYDRDLRRLFSDAPDYKQNPSAARFLTRIRKEVRRTVARWTGEYQYTIDQVLDDIISRCRELKLRLAESEEQTKLDFTIVLTVQTMNYLHSGQHRVWL